MSDYEHEPLVSRQIFSTRRIWLILIGKLPLW